ncbi:hypothetical protein MBANPS3_007509 [Mucor bainieri]
MSQALEERSASHTILNSNTATLSSIYIDSIVVPSTRMGSCFNYKIKDQSQYKAATGMSSIQSDLYNPNRGAAGTIILDEKRMDKAKRESDSGYSSNDSDSANGY